MHALMLRVVALALLLAEVNFRCAPQTACEDDKKRSCEEDEETETEETETGETPLDLGA
jgi:hypothetical protein